jgi:hypothetical protein
MTKNKGETLYLHQSKKKALRNVMLVAKMLRGLNPLQLRRTLFDRNKKIKSYNFSR